MNASELLANTLSPGTPPFTLEFTRNPLIRF